MSALPKELFMIYIINIMLFYFDDEFKLYFLKRHF